MSLFDRISLPVFVLLALALGMAPFFPEPHVVEKIRMLIGGGLVRPIDIFDLVVHLVPWILLIIKLIRMALVRSS